MVQRTESARGGWWFFCRRGKQKRKDKKRGGEPLRGSSRVIGAARRGRVLGGGKVSVVLPQSRFRVYTLGQYSGKFSRTVSSRIFNRVLLPQKGHKSILSSCYLPLCLAFFFPAVWQTGGLSPHLSAHDSWFVVPAYIAHAGVSTPAAPLFQCLYPAVGFEFRAAYVWD